MFNSINKLILADICTLYEYNVPECPSAGCMPGSSLIIRLAI